MRRGPHHGESNEREAIVMIPTEPAHARKPDPDEPWRYACPGCDNQVQGTPSGRYRCTHCNDRWDFDELTDRKAD